jgi:hypothetical protein
MNERIKALLKLATVTHFSDMGAMTDKVNQEKFAELIVAECLQVINQTTIATTVTGPKEWVHLNDTVDNIKEHFGVE